MKRFSLIILATFFLIASAGLTSSSNAFMSFFDKYKEVTASNGRITIPLTDVNDGQAHFFTYAYQGKEVRFFLVKSGDNVIRAAFDACDVCYPARKGYVQEGEYMVCVNCGRKFHVSRINVEKGGCNPAPLNRVFDEKTVTILASDIAKGQGYF